MNLLESIFATCSGVVLAFFLTLFQDMWARRLRLTCTGVDYQMMTDDPQRIKLQATINLLNSSTRPVSVADVMVRLAADGNGLYYRPSKVTFSGAEGDMGTSFVIPAQESRTFAVHLCCRKDRNNLFLFQTPNYSATVVLRLDRHRLFQKELVEVEHSIPIEALWPAHGKETIRSPKFSSPWNRRYGVYTPPFWSGKQTLR